MEKQNKRLLWSALGFFAAFVLWTVLVCRADVRPDRVQIGKGEQQCISASISCAETSGAPLPICARTRNSGMFYRPTLRFLRIANTAPTGYPLNDILRLYQIYFRDTFYCGLPEAEAADKLLARLKKRLDLPDADEARLTERLQAAFEAEGYHALFGKTQGYYGPYVWRETVPAVYQVELPDGSAEYTVNLLKGFVFRSWMDYLTFGRYGTGGWASPDGTINCIEQAYDLESERFRVSLLKHEAQHTVDRKRFPQITPAELEYRAKLVELHFSGDPGLLQKFLSEADESKPDDSHAVASARIGREFADTDQTVLSCIQTRALELLRAHTRELEEKYGESRDHPNGEAV